MLSIKAVFKLWFFEEGKDITQPDIHRGKHKNICC